MKILIYGEVVDGRVSGSTLELVTLARHLRVPSEGTVELLVLGEAPSDLAIVGEIDAVVTFADPALAHYTSEAYSICIEAAIKDRAPDLVLFSYTSSGLDLAPFVAIRSDFDFVGNCADISQIDGELVARSQVYGGRLVATSKLNLPAVVSVTPGSYPEATSGTHNAEKIHLPSPRSLAQGAMHFVSEETVPNDTIDITTVERLLCVGRGIGEQENIDQAQSLADALGAVLVGSRPIVDAGWLPKERQVGKSGRKVKPRLYLSLGVSGAPEHLEGMAAAELIIAINTDEKAPIFQVAHFGAIVDTAKFIPALKEALAAGRP